LLCRLQAVREDIFEVGPEGMSVQDLASMLALPATEVVKFLFMKGIMVQVGGWFGGCFQRV
jgi:translation initiation factor IF-2